MPLAAFVCLATTLAIGCAASSESADDSSSSDLTSAAPVTLGNFLNHPKIKEIRAEVAAVDAAKLATASEKEGPCPDDDVDQTVTKGTDDGGKIRKLIVAWGGSDGDGTTSYYYDAAGHLRFVFDHSETTPANDSMLVIESRVYFDAAGNRIFDVEKVGKGTISHPPNMDNAPFSLPNDKAQVPTTPFEVLPELQTDPGSFYNTPPNCD
jgi:hypothetical protein